MLPEDPTDLCLIVLPCPTAVVRGEPVCGLKDQQDTARQTVPLQD